MNLSLDNGVPSFHLVSSRPGPRRLMIGGIHGRERNTTSPILRALVDEGEPISGMVVVVPCLCSAGSKHVSTLRRAYYETEEGRRMIALIGEVKPQIYVELHCYRPTAYTALTVNERRIRKGVPPLVDLGNGLLMGSTSHHVLPFLLAPPGILLEVPCKHERRDDALAILRILRDSDDVIGAIRSLRSKYPEQVSRAIRLYLEWIAHYNFKVGGKVGGEEDKILGTQA